MAAALSRTRFYVHVHNMLDDLDQRLRLGVGGLLPRSSAQPLGIRYYG
jgi:hypothetical protein